MQQLTIRLPEEYFSKIEQISKSTGLKKSDITRMAIRKFIEEYSLDNDKRPYLRAQHLLGVVESGISDLGQNHRKYLLKKMHLATSLRELAGGWSERDARDFEESIKPCEQIDGEMWS